MVQILQLCFGKGFVRPLGRVYFRLKLDQVVYEEERLYWKLRLGFNVIGSLNIFNRSGIYGHRNRTRSANELKSLNVRDLRCPYFYFCRLQSYCLF